EQHRGGRRERQQGAGKAHEFPRIGVAMKVGHPVQPDKLSRTAPAAAKGLSRHAPREKAAKSPKAPLPPVPSRKAATAPAPKITAGVSSGRMIRGRSKPPRFKDRVRLAPMAPTLETAGVPIKSDRKRIPVASGERLNNRASSGEIKVSGRPVESQCAAILA